MKRILAVILCLAMFFTFMTCTAHGETYKEAFQTAFFGRLDPSVLTQGLELTLQTVDTYREIQLIDGQFFWEDDDNIYQLPFTGIPSFVKKVLDGFITMEVLYYSSGDPVLEIIHLLLKDALLKGVGVHIGEDGAYQVIVNWKMSQMLKNLITFGDDVMAEDRYVTAIAETLKNLFMQDRTVEEISKELTESWPDIRKDLKKDKTSGSLRMTFDLAMITDIEITGEGKLTIGKDTWDITCYATYGSENTIFEATWQDKKGKETGISFSQLEEDDGRSLTVSVSDGGEEVSLYMLSNEEGIPANAVITAGTLKMDYDGDLVTISLGDERLIGTPDYISGEECIISFVPQDRTDTLYFLDILLEDSADGQKTVAKLNDKYGEPLISLTMESGSAEPLSAAYPDKETVLLNTQTFLDLIKTDTISE